MARLATLLPLLLVLPCWAGAQTVTLDSAGREVRITAGDDAVLPADFPADVALPHPHTLVQVRRAGEAVTVEADAPGDAAGILSQLHARMLAAGWKAAAVAPPAEGRAQAWEKDHRAVVVWAKPAVDGVRLQLQLLPHR